METKVQLNATKYQRDRRMGELIADSVAIKEYALRSGHTCARLEALKKNDWFRIERCDPVLASYFVAYLMEKGEFTTNSPLYVVALVGDNKTDPLFVSRREPEFIAIPTIEGFPVDLLAASTDSWAKRTLKAALMHDPEFEKQQGYFNTMGIQFFDSLGVLMSPNIPEMLDDAVIRFNETRHHGLVYKGRPLADDILRTKW